MVKTTRWILLILFPTAVLILSFQNCGQVSVKPSEKQNLPSVSSQSIKISICSERAEGQAPVIIQNFFVANVTAKPVAGILEPDSDMDGLADHTEVDRGSNPQNPRSLGKILDVLCADGGAACSPTTCTDSIAGFLLLDCDLRAAVSGSSLNGKDSDRDGLPDYFEILRELKPAEAAIASSNNDFDSQPYLLEALNGSDPNFRESDPTALWMSTEEVHPDPSTTCASNQEVRTYTIPALKFVPTLAFQDFNPNTGLTWSRNTPHGPLDLSHAAGENVFMIFYTVRSPQGTGSGATFKTMSYLFKQSQTGGALSLDISDSNFTPMN